MLKRQRLATPPPSSLDDPLLFLPDGPIRPFQPSNIVDPSQPCSKRQRVRPPPLDGALRGWLESGPAGPHWESDGEEDWVEDEPNRPPLSPWTTADQYKDANSLLHELHVLNQHRLLFAHSPRDRHLDPSLGGPLPIAHAHSYDLRIGQRPTAFTEGSPYRYSPLRPISDRPADRSCCTASAEKGLFDEVQCVRQRYEDTNRSLGSLFLSRRREVEEMACSTGPSPSR